MMSFPVGFNLYFLSYLVIFGLPNKGIMSRLLSCKCKQKYVSIYKMYDKLFIHLKF